MVTCERPTPARTNVTRLSRNAPACRFKLRMNRKSGTRLNGWVRDYRSHPLSCIGALSESEKCAQTFCNIFWIPDRAPPGDLRPPQRMGTTRRLCRWISCDLGFFDNDSMGITGVKVLANFLSTVTLPADEISSGSLSVPFRNQDLVLPSRAPRFRSSVNSLDVLDALI